MGSGDATAAAAIDERSISALARAFRDSVTGVADVVWSPRQLGALSVIAFDGQSLRADHLHRARAALRGILSAFAAHATERFHNDATRATVAGAVGGYWGVERYPVSQPDPEGKRIRVWAEKVSASEAARARAAAIVVELAADGMSAGPAGDGPHAASWLSVSADEWPPAGSERAALVRRVREQLGELPHPLEGTDWQYLQILRRRAGNLHDAYLDGNRRTNTRFFHLRHHMMRGWFHEDLLDLRGAPGHDGDTAGGRLDPAVVRSQAAIAALFFHGAVQEWSHSEFAQIARRRADAARSGFGDQPIMRFLRSGAQRDLAQPPSTDDHMKPPSLALSALADSAVARSISMLAGQVRATKDVGVARRYIAERHALDWDSRGATDRRIILLADQSVHLDIVGEGRADPSLRADLDRLLEESAQMRPEYRSYIHRDHSLSRAKSGRLDAAIEEGQNGLRAIGLAYDDRGATSLERALVEAEHQSNLLMAGNAVKLVERAIATSASRRQAGHAADEVIAARVRAALTWSAMALEALNLLEAQGWLDAKRYQQHHLGETAWKAQTRIIRHRCLCAAQTMLTAYGLSARSLDPDDPLRGLGIDLLDEAYLDMIAVDELGTGHVNSLTQASLWHGFLTGNRLPFEPDRIASGVRAVDHLTTADTADHAGRVTIDVDAQRRELATVRLLTEKWDCGAIETAPRGSRVWFALDAAGDGAYSAWRAQLIELRLAPHA